MMIIKWKKDELEEEPLYDLYIFVGDNNYKMHIGKLGWGSSEQCWFMWYSIPPLKDKYKNYNQHEINDVLFRAVLDIQSDLSQITNMCIEYCNAISDYVIDYVQGIDHNED